MKHFDYQRAGTRYNVFSSDGPANRFSVYRKGAPFHIVATCDNRDDAEMIVEALNERYNSRADEPAKA